MRIDRLLSITIMLLSRRSVTAQQLAERFDVTVRTVYRDMEALNAAGIPVVSYQGAGGGYCLMENYRIDRQVFSLDDMLSITAAFKGLNATLSHNHFQQLIEKIDSLIPPDKKEGLQKRSEPLAFDMSQWGPPDERLNTCMRDLYTAAVDRCAVRFSYYASSGGTSTRTVEPVTVLCKSFSWYLFAFCRLRKDYRLFKLCRISELTILQEQFSPHDVSYQDTIGDSQKKQKAVHLLLRFAPSRRAQVEEYFHGCSVDTQSDGRLQVSFCIPEDEWVYGMILSYGPDVEVVEPDHIRTVIADRAEKIGKIYESGAPGSDTPGSDHAHLS